MAKAKKFTTVKAAPVPDEARAPYKPAEARERREQHNVDPNAEPAKEDRVYGVASRARWEGGSDIAQLHRESRQIEGAEVSEEEEEEEEETSANDLTVAELKAALEEAQVEIPAGAKKADLVALYEEHNLGDAE